MPSASDGRGGGEGDEEGRILGASRRGRGGQETPGGGCCGMEISAVNGQAPLSAPEGQQRGRPAILRHTVCGGLGMTRGARASWRTAGMILRERGGAGLKGVLRGLLTAR